MSRSLCLACLYVILKRNRRGMSSNSPCAACKLLRRKCTPGCVFAPYFPPDQPWKFACVHRVFGASNVAKLLSDLSPAQREDAANSLAFEAQMRVQDPVYGCVGYISMLQQRLREVQLDLHAAKKELAAYIGSAAMGPFLPPLGHHPHHGHHAALPAASPYSVPPAAFALPTPQHAPVRMLDPPPLQVAEPAQHMAMAAVASRDLDAMRGYYHHRQQNLGRLSADGFSDQIGDDTMVPVAVVPSSGLSLMPSAAQSFDTPQHYLEQQPHHHRAGSDEGRSGIRS